MRQRLERYYVDEGRNATLEIHLPVGNYVPMLRRRENAADADSLQARDLVERGDYRVLRKCVTSHRLPGEGRDPI